MEEIVHIIPLGFEIDRVVKPFGKLKANRVYILYSTKKLPKNPSKDQRNDPLHYLKAVKSQLDQMKIDVVPQDIDIFNILELMSAISRIIVKEKADKNNVYVNMCAAGKLTSVASTLAAMYHDAKVYYINADEYPTEEKSILEHGLSIVNEPKYTILTNFKIDIPTGAKGALLVELHKRGQMTTIDILRMIGENRLKGFEDTTQLRMVEKRHPKIN
jgi:hypothetical protein